MDCYFRMHDDPCDPSAVSQIFNTAALEKEHNTLEEQQGRYALLYIMVSFSFFPNFKISNTK